MTLTDDELEAAWAAVHDATPAGWYVGRPSYHDERHEWVIYGFDQRERAVNAPGAASGRRSVPPECLLEMARCLRALGAGRMPL